jgi:hypothetical protein
MASKLIILPQAQIEIDKAIAWYESQQIGLGKTFFNYLDGYFNILRDGSFLFALKRKPAFRELPLKKFPFIIIYEVTQTETLIYSVFNTLQNPNIKDALIS